MSSFECGSPHNNTQKTVQWISFPASEERLAGGFSSYLCRGFVRVICMWRVSIMCTLLLHAACNGRALVFLLLQGRPLLPLLLLGGRAGRFGCLALLLLLLQFPLAPRLVSLDPSTLLLLFLLPDTAAYCCRHGDLPLHSCLPSGLSLLSCVFLRRQCCPSVPLCCLFFY